MSISDKPVQIMGGKVWYYQDPEGIEIIVTDALNTINGGNSKFVRMTNLQLRKAVSWIPRRKKVKK